MNHHQHTFFITIIEESKLRRENYRLAKSLNLITDRDYNAWLEPIVNEQVKLLEKELKHVATD